MNGIEKITEQILADAAAYEQQVMQQAEQQALEIAAEYEAGAEAQSETLLEKSNEQVAETTRRILAIAELEARKKKLAAKQRLIAVAFDQAEQQLNGMPAADYGSLLARLAAQNAQTGDEVVLLGTDDRAALGEMVVREANALLSAQGKPGKLTLSQKTREFGRGLILCRGNIEINCSFGALIAAQREKLSAEVAGVLFA